VQAAPEWDNLMLRYSGWFGGDGIFAIPASGIEYQEKDDSTVNIILFSDTMIGEIVDGELKEGYRMVNNSIAYMQGKEPLDDNMSYHIAQDTSGKDKSIFEVELPLMEKGEYYWLGDGFVNPANKHTYIFAYRVVNRPEFEVFQFEVLGGALIKVPAGSRFPFEDQVQFELPYFYKPAKQVIGSFGAGILLNTETSGVPDPDGYIYVYGVLDPGKQLLVSRVKPENFEDLDLWRFWNGDAWVSDFKEAAALTDMVSNELSVTPVPGGKYLLVFSVGGVQQSVAMRIGESPVGPFGPVITIWDCSEAIEEPEFFAYNAKAHPSLSKPGELLVSYNVNSFAFWDQVEAYPNLYRPRFFKINY
jgi:hypothetical protein